MAFDALRLRNIIQLLGILSTPFQLLLGRARTLNFLQYFTLRSLWAPPSRYIRPRQRLLHRKIAMRHKAIL